MRSRTIIGLVWMASAYAAAGHAEEQEKQEKQEKQAEAAEAEPARAETPAEERAREVAEAEAEIAEEPDPLLGDGFLLGLGAEERAVGEGTREVGRRVSRVGEGVEPVGEGVAPVGRAEVAPAGSFEERITLSGRVTSVDEADGSALVRANTGEDVRVRGRPLEIAALVPGNQVSVPVQELGGELWIEPAARLEPGSAAVTAEPGTGAAARDVRLLKERGRAHGIVTGISPDEGALIVGNDIIRAHPSQVEGIQPGQMVSVTYGVIAGTKWADEVLVGAAVEGEDTFAPELEEEEREQELPAGELP